MINDSAVTGVVTDTMPTEPGYYWFGDDVVQVFVRPGHSYLCVAGEPTGMGKRDFVAVAQMPRSKWSARIPTPAEAALSQAQPAKGAECICPLCGLRHGCTATSGEF